MKLTRVNEFLKKNEICVQQENPILNAPDTIKNIVVSEIIDIARLEKISDELITYLSKDLKRQSRKDQQSFLRDVETIKANKRDFVFNVAKEVNKNDFLNKIFNMATQSSETVISENGEVFESSITEENRKALQALLIDLVNDQTRV
jgi:hypothetical protein